MQLKLETITPEIASKILGANTDNRKLNLNHVKFLSDQIVSGNWKETGDPVKIAPNGRLLDGQHRLSAIVKSEHPISVWVARDVPEEVFTVLDTGKVRSAGDALSIAGLKSSTSQAALAKAVMAYDSGKINNKSRSITNQETLDFCKQHDLLPSVNLAATYALKGSPVKAGIIAITHYLFSRIDQDQADSFMESLCLGVNIQKGSALYLIREKLNKAVLGRYDLSKWETVALIIKAWNYTRSGAVVPSIIIYNPEREEFPVVF